jgi:hypothetical protein
MRVGFGIGIGIGYCWTLAYTDCGIHTGWNMPSLHDLQSHFSIRGFEKKPNHKICALCATSQHRQKLRKHLSFLLVQLDVLKHRVDHSVIGPTPCHAAKNLYKVYNIIKTNYVKVYEGEIPHRFIVGA